LLPKKNEPEKPENFLNYLIEKFKTIDISREFDKIKQRITNLAVDFPKRIEKDTEYKRKFILANKLLISVLEQMIQLPDLTFSWEDFILNLLYLEKDPNLIIKSQLREIKRRNSYNTYLLIKKDKIIQDLEKELFKHSKFKQKSLIEYL